MENIFNEENLEDIYNILKGSNNELSKNVMKNYLQKLELDESDLLSYKIDDDKSDKNEEISLESFKSMILNKNKENQNAKDYFEKEDDCFKDTDNSELMSQLKSGFDLMDSGKKGYLVIADLKKLNKIFNMQFTDDDLEGLLEVASKSEYKLNFDKFVNFCLKE